MEKAHVVIPTFDDPDGKLPWFTSITFDPPSETVLYWILYKDELKPRQIVAGKVDAPRVNVWRLAHPDAKASSAFGQQVGGDHYRKMKIQPFQFSMANGLDPLQHTIIKYVCRFRDKNGKVDLEKAKHCIDLLIENDYGSV